MIFHTSSSVSGLFLLHGLSFAIHSPMCTEATGVCGSARAPEVRMLDSKIRRTGDILRDFRQRLESYEASSVTGTRSAAVTLFTAYSSLMSSSVPPLASR